MVRWRRWPPGPAGHQGAGQGRSTALDLHSPLHCLGVMDPLCGITRGTVAVLRGQLGRSWAFSPISPLLVAGAVLAVGRWLVGRLTGRWLDATIRPTPSLWAVAAIMVVALWANQQAHVGLLR
jgi:hypothetical protein